jgi:hypothetical protein
MLLIAASLPAAAQAPTGGDIFRSWIGKTLDAETTKGAKVKLAFASDGAVSMSGAFADTGKWRATDDGYCTTWQKSRSGKEECYSVVPDGRVFLVRFKSTGELSGRVLQP